MENGLDRGSYRTEFVSLKLDGKIGWSATQDLAGYNKLQRNGSGEQRRPPNTQFHKRVHNDALCGSYQNAATAQVDGLAYARERGIGRARAEANAELERIAKFEPALL